MNTPQQDYSLRTDNGIGNINTLIRETLLHFDSYRFPKDIKNYKQYFGFNVDRLSNIESWQANISYPIGASIINSTFANMYDFGYEFGVTEEKIRKLLNETFDFRGQGRIALGDMIKEGLITGKGFCRTSFLQEETSMKVFGEHEIKTFIKKPTIKYISKFNVFYDHNYSVEDSPYQIERNLMTGDAILKKYKGIVSDEEFLKLPLALKKDSEINDAWKNCSVYSTNNYNPIKDILSYQHSIMLEFAKKRSKKEKFTNIGQVVSYFSPDTSMITGDTSSSSISASNMFKYDKEKTYEVIEYESLGDVHLFINGKNVAKYDIIKRGVGRIRQIEFNRIPGTSESLGVMDIIGDLQVLLDSIWNGFIDNIKMQLSGMFKVKGNVDGAGTGNVMKFTKFGILRLKGDADIERFEMGLGDFMPLNMVQFLDGFMSKLIGVNDYHLGGQHKVERVADGIDFMRSQYKSKLAVMIDSIQRLMSNVARDWISAYLTRYTEEELKELGLEFKVEKEEGKPDKYTINGIEIRKILSEDSITFTYNALETIDMERDRERIMTLFTPLAQNGMVDQEQLWNVGLGKNFDRIWKEAKDGKNPGANQNQYQGGNDIPDSMGKTLTGQVFDKYNAETIPQEEGNGATNILQPPMNSATTAKIPGGAKLRKITNEISSTDITSRLSI